MNRVCSVEISREYFRFRSNFNLQPMPMPQQVYSKIQWNVYTFETINLESRVEKFATSFSTLHNSDESNFFYCFFFSLSREIVFILHLWNAASWTVNLLASRSDSNKLTGDLRFFLLPRPHPLVFRTHVLIGEHSSWFQINKTKAKKMWKSEETRGKK